MRAYKAQRAHSGGVDLHAAGPPLGLVMLYEADATRRFARVGNVLSYPRPVTGTRERAGEVTGVGGRKIGNAHVEWASSEAASLMVRGGPAAKAWMPRQSKTRGVEKAPAVLDAKIGRTAYRLWWKPAALDGKRPRASGVAARGHGEVWGGQDQRHSGEGTTWASVQRVGPSGLG